jgi:hypothetical protein
MGAGELARAPMKSCFRLFKLFSLQRGSVKNRDAPAILAAGGLQLHHSQRCVRIPAWQKGIPRTAPNICLRGIAVL